jgi:hypothetical protein
LSDYNLKLLCQIKIGTFKSREVEKQTFAGACGGAVGLTLAW